MRSVILPRVGLLLMLVLFAAGLAQARDPDRLSSFALKGYDPVAYFTEGRPVRGSRDFRHEFDGSRYLFSSAKHRDMFAANPGSYAPQFDGLCTTGVAIGVKEEADPTVWKIQDGKLYVFYSQSAKKEIEDEPALLSKAQKAWKPKK